MTASEAMADNRSLKPESAIMGGALNSRAMRDAFGCYGTGVAIATTRSSAGAPVGLTINSFSSLSLDPPLVLWSIDLGAGSLSAFREASKFAINILSEGQADIARLFAKADVCRFSNAPHAISDLDLPVIDGALATLECAVETRHPGGDHEIMVGRVLRISHAIGLKPLVFWRGAFRSLK